MKQEKKSELMLKAKGKSAIQFLDNLTALFCETDPNRSLEELKEDLTACGVDVEASWERTKQLLAKYGIYPEGWKMKYFLITNCRVCPFIGLYPTIFFDGALCIHAKTEHTTFRASHDQSKLDGKQIYDTEAGQDGAKYLPELIPPPGWCPLPDLPEPQKQATPGDALRFQLWIVDAENTESVAVECWECGAALNHQGIHDFVEHCDYCVECAIKLGYWEDYGDIPL